MGGKGRKTKSKAVAPDNGGQPGLKRNKKGGKVSTNTNGPQLEFPEGYCPSKCTKKQKHRRKNVETNNLHINLEPVSKFEKCLSRNMSTFDLRYKAQYLAIDLNPTFPRQLLRFNEKRQWVSISNHEEYLLNYAETQKNKYMPLVYGDEGTTEDVAHQKTRKDSYATKSCDEHLKVLEKLKVWPNTHQITTKAPFILSEEWTLKENINNQTLAICQVFAIPEIGNTVLHYIGHQFRNLSSLGLTCWTIFKQIKKHLHCWNLSSQDFHGFDKKADVDKSPPNTQIVVVSPVRGSMLPDNTHRELQSYETEFMSMTNLCKALHHRSLVITNLQLHRVFYLDVNAVDCIVGALPYLQSLGIYQCPLLHFGETGKLLDTIKRYKKVTGYVTLDFFPRYHQGPNSTGRKGSFGVTWSDPGLDTTAGVFQRILYEYFPKARRVGLDLFEETGAFRLWLEQCPFPDWSIVRLNEAIKTYEKNRKIRSVAKEWVADFDDAAFKVLADEVAAAMFGDNTEPGNISPEVLRHLLIQRQKGEPLLKAQYRKYGWWSALSKGNMTCPCGGQKLVSFFPYNDHRRCYGCMLIGYLHDEDDHMKPWLKKAMYHWIGGDSDPDRSARELEELWSKDDDEPDTAEDSSVNSASLVAAQASVQQAQAADFGKGDWKIIKKLSDAVSEENSYRLLTGKLVASKTDIIHEHERTHSHGTHDPDHPWHVNYRDLIRRYRRSQEPHGPVDRRRSDCQYKAFGEENFLVSLDLYPEHYSYSYFDRFNDQIFWRRIGTWVQRNGYETALVVFRDLVGSTLNIMREHVAAHSQLWEERRQTACKQDRQAIHDTHRLWQLRVEYPNRPAGNWDLMRRNWLNEWELSAYGRRITLEEKDMREWRTTIRAPY